MSDTAVFNVQLYNDVYLTVSTHKIISDHGCPKLILKDYLPAYFGSFLLKHLNQINELTCLEGT